jgi:hypothetical protein
MKTSEILMKALDIIDVPGQWTKGAMAKDMMGNEVFPDDTNACKWCSIGALGSIFVGGELFTTEHNSARSILKSSAKFVYGTSISSLNDASKTPFDEEISEMWLGAIFCALADETV